MLDIEGTSNNVCDDQYTEKSLQQTSVWVLKYVIEFYRVKVELVDVLNMKCSTVSTCEPSNNLNFSCEFYGYSDETL